MSKKKLSGLLKNAKESVQELLGYNAVPLEDTLNAMEELKYMVESYVEGLEEDIENERLNNLLRSYK